METKEKIVMRYRKNNAGATWRTVEIQKVLPREPKPKDYAILYDKDGKSVFLSKDKIVGEGGEARIYRYGKNKVAKIFKKSDEERENKLRTLLQMKVDSAFCLPERLLYDEDQCLVGYIMPYITGHVMGASLFQPMEFSNIFPNWSRIELTKLAIRCLEAVESMHKAGVIIGDLNDKNILIQDSNKVKFIDVDSYQVGEYNCKVGTTAFTSPRLQGKNFANERRVIDDDNFAVTTLIFMIFLLGKPPYRNEGSNLGENIKSMNFDFAFETEDGENGISIDDKWSRIWDALPFNIRNAFYDAFKLGRFKSIAEWISMLKEYCESLENNEYSRSIFPHGKRLMQGSFNMNLRDIKEDEVALRNPYTILRGGLKEKIAVLELSTKAVKLIFGKKEDGYMRTEKFSFDNFHREAIKTDTGRGLDKRNVMDMEYFDRRVLPVIVRFVDIARQQGVTKLCTVATAAYRNATNRLTIIEHIKERAGINVKILKKSEEASATIQAYQFSTTKKEELQSAKVVMMIDQGGGSTEVSLYEDKLLIANYSINLGTEILRSYLFHHNQEGTSLYQGLADTDRLISARLEALYKSDVGQKISALSAENIYTVAVGTAITKACGRKSNKGQHDVKMKMDDITACLKQSNDYLIHNYPLISTMYKATNKGIGEKYNDLEAILIVRLGLKMFQLIMKRCSISSVTICGTGLWYGIYFSEIFGLNND